MDIGRLKGPRDGKSLLSKLGRGFKGHRVKAGEASGCKSIIPMERIIGESS
jgi:hypothetical protein